MTTAKKILNLRNEYELTQDQLGRLIGVEAEYINEFESGITAPNTEQLIRLSEVFHCSIDYLLKDYVEERDGANIGLLPLSLLLRDRKSKKTIFGMPLWHVGKNAKGFIAVGIKARGIISIGVFSMGLFSVGVCSLGLISVAVVALGLFFALGCFALGAFACGAIACGIFALGAIAIGEFSLGALSYGHYLAIGDHAYGMFAVGASKANGDIFETTKLLTDTEKKTVLAELISHVPKYYHFIAKWLFGIL